jgi:hypothetical protein
MAKENVSWNDYEFLLNWVFGEERTVSLCVKTSYRDVQRNLRGMGKMPENEKQKYKDKICELISRRIDDLFKDGSNTQESFDQWHKNTCDEICQKSRKMCSTLTKEFSYGLAQKWLNMTIKNMLIMKQWDAQLNQIKKHLHIPVDNYIVEEASNKFSVKVFNRKGERKPYGASASMPWSQWGYEEYIQFQKDIRNAVECPVDWEFGAWIEIRNKRTQT